MFEGIRILIVEDEPLIAFDLEAAVIEVGGAVVGPAHTLRDALQLAASEPIDAAILDVRLGNDLAIPVIDQLHRRGIPCVLHTGQTDPTLTSLWPGVPVIGKPARADVLLVTLKTEIDRRRQR